MNHTVAVGAAVVGSVDGAAVGAALGLDGVDVVGTAVDGAAVGAALGLDGVDVVGTVDGAAVDGAAVGVALGSTHPSLAEDHQRPWRHSQVVLHEVPLRSGSSHTTPSESPQAEAEHAVMEPTMRLEPLVRNTQLRTDAVPP